MNDVDATLDPVPDSIRELERACIGYVSRALGIELDGTPETLPILDHYLTSADVQEKDEVATLVVSAAGAYFGEVVRRALGDGRWHVEADPRDHRLEFEQVFLFFNPLGMAREAIDREAAAGWMAHLEVSRRDRERLERSLSQMGQIREDDYYRLAVRFEVIEQALETLHASATERSSEPEFFAPAAYAAAVEAIQRAR